MRMPQTLEELAEMISDRDKTSFLDAIDLVRECAKEMQYAFYNGSLSEAEDILRDYLGLEPDFLDIFIF